MAFSAGAITSKLTLDRSKFSASMKAVQKQTRTLGGWVKQNSAQFKRMGIAAIAAGTAVLVVFKKMVKQYVETGDMIHKMALRTGFAAETLSELAYAADISGADITMLEKGVKKMSKTIVDASYGLETYLRVFRSLGLDVEDLMKLTPEEQFLKIGAAIAAMESDTLRTAAAVDVLGRAGTMLLPLFAEGAEGIAKLREEAHTLGIIFDEEAAAKAAALKDAQTALTGSVKGLSIAILNDLIPVLTDVTKEFTDWFVGTRKDAAIWARALLTFFKAIAQGIQAMMLAWHGFQALVFKGAALITKHLGKQVSIMVKTLLLMEKLPFVGKKLIPVTDKLVDLWKDLDYITEGYNESAEKQIDTLTNIITGFENFFAVLDKIGEGLKDSKKDMKGLGETITDSVLPPARELGDIFGATIKPVREFYGALDQVQSSLDSYVFTTEKVLTANEELMKSWGLTTEAQLTFTQAALGEFMMMEASLQGFVDAILGTFEKWAIGQIIPKIMAALPFPVNLLATGGAILAIKTIFKSIRGMAEGGRMGAREPAIVGEAGPELWVPKTAGTIIPLRGDAGGARVSFNFYAPIIQTTGIAHRDLDGAAEYFFRKMRGEARRRGYKLNG